MISSIYVEVITVGKNYRVSITDEDGNASHPFLPLFDDYDKAERYAKEMTAVLMRFSAGLRNFQLTPKGN